MQPLMVVTLDFHFGHTRSAPSYRIRLPVIGGAERKLFVSASELTTENAAEFCVTQCESASGTGMTVPLPTRLFLLIHPWQGNPLAGCMRRKIDVGDRVLVQIGLSER